MKRPKGAEVITSGGKTLARNQAVLARELGLNLRTMKDVVKRPGNPGTDCGGYYDIEAWREFYATYDNGSTMGRPKINVDLSANERHEHAIRKAAADLQTAEEKARMATLEREEMEGKSVGIDEATKIFSELAAAVKDTLAAMGNNIARDMAGCDVPEATKRIKDASRNVLEKLALGEWAKKKTFWSRLYAMQFGLLEMSPRGRGVSSTATTP